MFFIAYAFKRHVHAFAIAGRVKVVRQDKCKFLNIFVPCKGICFFQLDGRKTFSASATSKQVIS